MASSAAAAGLPLRLALLCAALAGAKAFRTLSKEVEGPAPALRLSAKSRGELLDAAKNGVDPTSGEVAVLFTSEADANLTLNSACSLQVFYFILFF